MSQQDRRRAAVAPAAPLPVLDSEIDYVARYAAPPTAAELGMANPVQSPDYTQSGNPQDMLRDPRFLNDLRAYYEGQGISDQSDEQLVRRFYGDGNWRDLNSIGIVSSTMEAYRSNPEQRERIRRIQSVYEQLPDFWQSGGRGVFSRAPIDIAVSVLADPLNLLPGAKAVQAGAQAARAGGSVLRAAARTGALYEGAMNAGIEAGANTLTQLRDQQLGLQEGFSPLELGLSTAAGGVLGGAVGGLLGAAVSPLARRRGEAQTQALTGLGYQPDEVRGFSDAEAQRIIGAGTQRPITPREGADPFGPPAPEQFGPTYTPGDIDLEPIDAAIQRLTGSLDTATRKGADPADIAAINADLVRHQQLRQLGARIQAEAAEIGRLEASTSPGDLGNAARRRARLNLDQALYRSLLDDPERPLPPEVTTPRPPEGEAPTPETGSPRAPKSEAPPEAPPPPEGEAPAPEGATPPAPTTPTPPSAPTSSGDPAARLRALMDTDANYQAWSNVRDGSDRDGFRAQIERPLLELAKVDPAKLTLESIEKYLANNKAFHNNDRRQAAAILVEQFGRKAEPPAPTPTPAPAPTPGPKAEAPKAPDAAPTGDDLYNTALTFLKAPGDAITTTSLGRALARAGQKLTGTEVNALLKRMESEGLVSAPGEGKKRTVLRAPSATSANPSPAPATAPGQTGAPGQTTQTPDAPQTSGENSPTAPTSAPTSAPPGNLPDSSSNPPATPRVTKPAADLLTKAGIDPTTVSGTGKGGAVTATDARRAINEKAEFDAEASATDTLADILDEAATLFGDAAIRNRDFVATLIDQDPRAKGIGDRIKRIYDEQLDGPVTEARDPTDPTKMSEGDKEIIRKLAGDLKETMPALNREQRLRLAETIFNNNPDKYRPARKGPAPAPTPARVADRTGVASDTLATGPKTAGRDSFGRIQALLRRGADFGKADLASTDPRAGRYSITSDIPHTGAFGSEEAKLIGDRAYRDADAAIRDRASAILREAARTKQKIDVQGAFRHAREERAKLGPVTPFQATGRTRVADGKPLERGERGFYDPITKRFWRSLDAMRVARGEKPLRPASTPEAAPPPPKAAPAPGVDADILRAAEDQRRKLMADFMAGKITREQLFAQARKIADATTAPQAAPPAAPQAATPAPAAAKPAPEPPPFEMPARDEAGRVLAIRSKADPREVRVLGKTQLDNPTPLAKLLGREKVDDWDVGYVPEGTPSMSRRAADAFAPTAVGDATGRGKPMSSAEFDALRIDTKTLSTAEKDALLAGLDVAKASNPIRASKAAEKIEAGGTLTGGDLRTITNYLDLFSRPNTRAEHQATVKHLTALYGLQARLAPQGFTRNHATRAEAIEAASKIMARFGAETADEAARLIGRLGGDTGVGPRLVDSTGPLPPEVRVTPGGWSANSVAGFVGLGPNLTGYPSLPVFLHEIGHWAYNSILTPADRLEFWRALDKFYDEGGQINLDRMGAKSKIPNGGATVTDAAGIEMRIARNNYHLSAMSEFFADNFAMWAMQNRARPEFLEEGFWRRISRYISQLLDWFRDSKRVDDDLIPLFNKIMPEERQPRDPQTEIGKAIHARLTDLQVRHEEIDAAIRSGNPDAIIEAGKRAAGYLHTLAGGGKAANTFSPVKSYRRMIVDRKRALLDALGGDGTMVDGDGIKIVSAHSREEQARRIEELLTSGDLADGKPRGFSSISEVFDLLKHRMVRAYEGAEDGFMPPGIPADFKPMGRPFKSKARDAATRGRIAKINERKKAKATAEANSDTETPARERTRDPAKLADFLRRGIDIPADVRGMSLKKLQAEYPKHKGTPRGDQIAHELTVKARLDGAKPNVSIPPELTQKRVEELRPMLTDALSAGDKAKVEQIIAELGRRGEKRFGLIKSQQVNKATLTERAQNMLSPTDDAIPAAARPTVREMLQAMTHRDAPVQANLRLLAYRLLNLGGKAEAGTIDNPGLITVGDIARLNGPLAGTGTAASTTPLADLSSFEFKSLRIALRRVAGELARGEERAISSALTFLLRSDFLSPEDRYRIVQARTVATTGQVPAFRRGEDGGYPTVPLTEADEEWMSRVVARMSRGEGLGEGAERLANLPIGGFVEQIANKTADGLAYLLRGVTTDDTLMQRYPRLFAEDVFDVRYDAHPLMRGGLLESGPTSLVPEVARGIHATMPADAKARLDAFVGGSFDPVMGVRYAPVRAIADGVDNTLPMTDGPLGRGYYAYNEPSTEMMADRLDDHIHGLPEDRQGEAADLLVEFDQLGRTLSDLSQRWHYTSPASSRPDPDEHARLGQEISELVEEMMATEQALQTFGVEAPRMAPVVAAPRNIIALDAYSAYNTTDATFDHVVRSLADHPDVTDEAFDAFVGKLPAPGMARAIMGDELHAALVAAFERSGDPDPAEAVSYFLRDAGFDAIMAGGVRDAELPEGQFIFSLDDGRMRSMTSFMDAAEDDLVEAISDGSFSLNGPITQIMMSVEPGATPRSFGPIGEALAARGVGARVLETMSNIFRRRAPTGADGETIRRQAGLQLRSNASRMEKAGMSWLSGWYRDHFPTFHQEFAKRFMPLHEALQGLPDAYKGVVQWGRRSLALSGQPESHSKIMRALRHGDGSRQERALSDQERTVYRSIRQTFQDELRNQRQAGVMIGNLGPNYVPQVWQPDAIGSKPEEALAFFRKYYRREAEADGRAYTPDDADAFARGVVATLAEEDGIYLPPRGMSRNATGDHIDFQRMIRLDRFPDLLAEAEPFLENDLQTILVKYLDASTRRTLQTQKFGVNTHGYFDYMHVVERGLDGVAELLSRNKVVRKDVRVLAKDGVVDVLTFTDETRMPFQDRFEEARKAADEAARLAREVNPEAARRYLEGLSRMPEGPGRETYRKRVDAIVGALADFQGREGRVAATEVAHADASMRVAMKKPAAPTTTVGFGDTAVAVSKGLRNFNSVTLLGFTTLTSLPDIVMPILRSGSMRSYAKGLASFASDPDYRRAIRNVGVSMESIVADRMTYAFGQVDGKLTNAFFNATMLTPWTSMQRELAASTGYEFFKAMQTKAVRAMKGDGRDMSQQTAEFKRALRFLRRYGLEDYVYNGRTLDDVDLLRTDDALRDGIMRFTNDAIFSPGADEIPVWAQTPIGSIVFQLKSYPLMMSRMAKDVLVGDMMEFFKTGDIGYLKRPGYFLAFGPAFGMGALAVKDIVQMRGGEDEKSAELRQRNILKALGYDEKVHGNANDFLGWYFEGLMTMGGLGLLGDITQSVVSQTDNGAYGFQRILSTVFGPSVGTASAAFNVVAGVKDAALDGTPDSNAKERSAVREMAGRVPFLGGIRSLREGVVDEVAGEATGRSGGGNRQGGWGQGFGGLAWQGGWN